MLLPSLSLGRGFGELTVNEEKTINFYCLYPLYREEMELKLKNGRDALIDKFAGFRVRDIVDIKRPNTCKKRGLFGLW
jgi:hypothetical protein